MSIRPVPEGAKIYHGDINNEAQMKAFLDTNHFDVVVNWVAYTPDQVERDIRMFQGRVSQYVFISSASAYKKPVDKLPITEETPVVNPYWEYSQNKALCENLLTNAHRETGFPATIIRPSHTYDKTLLPFRDRYTIVDRMLKGKPVVVHGDGTSLWVLTHNRDFAKGFLPLLGNPATIGEAIHITSDMLLNWNLIFRIVADAFGGEFHPVYVPSEVIARYDADWGAGLLGDKMHSVIFDNSKVKSLVPGFKAEIPFEEGVKDMVTWYSQPENQVLEPEFDAVHERIIADWG